MMEKERGEGEGADKVGGKGVVQEGVWIHVVLCLTVREVEE